MTDPVVVFRATFRARGYTDEDLSDLRIEIEPHAAVRLRAQHLPEAGGVAEMAVVLEFIGVNLVKGGVVWIGGQLASRVTKGLTNWWTKRATRGPWEPEVRVIRISFDDVDVEFMAHRNTASPDAYFMSADVIAAVPDALQIVGQHFTAEVIAEHNISHVEVPLICYDSSEPEFEKARNGEPDRIWKVGKLAPFPTHLYDSERRAFIDLPPYLPLANDEQLEQAEVG